MSRCGARAALRSSTSATSRGENTGVRERGVVSDVTSRDAGPGGRGGILFELLVDILIF